MRVEEMIKAGAEVPTNGMPCTIHYYSDAEPAQVVKISKSGKTAWIRKNIVTVDPNSEGGMGHQDWVIHKDEFSKVGEEWDAKAGKYIDYEEPQLAKKPDGFTFFKITKRKDGCWRTTGSNLFVQLGIARKYFDYSF